MKSEWGPTVFILSLLAVIALWMITQAAAQAHPHDRLEEHAQMGIHQPGNSSVHYLRAICDTGTGTLLYVLTMDSHAVAPPQPVLVPNGCAKRKAESGQ
jgi:hypothetical protein